ncbi:MAG TPA: HDIG domain-containing metalloprotein [Stenomitos sp.]
MAYLTTCLSRQPPQSRSRQYRLGYRRSVVLALIALATLTGTIGYRYYNEPQITINSLAPQTIYAPKTVLVEDKMATLTARKAARQSALNVFALSQAATETIESDLVNVLSAAQALRNLAGPLPYLSGQMLSADVQRHLRRMDRAQLSDLIQSVESADPSIQSPARYDALPSFKQAWIELRRIYQQPQGQQKWTQLCTAVRQANERYQSAQRSTTDRLAAIQIEPILDIPDREWQQLAPKLQLTLHRMLAQGLAPGLPPQVAANAVAVQVSDWQPLYQQVAKQVLPAVLRSNLILDPVETLRQQEQAAQQTSPIMVQIRAGDVIVQHNQRVSSADFALLDYFNLSRRMPNFGGLFATLAGVTSAIVLFRWLRQRYYEGETRRCWSYRDDLLVLLLALSVPLMIGLTEVTYTTLPAVGILVGGFYGSILGAATVALLSLVVPLGIPFTDWTFGAIALGSLVGSVMAGQARSREELARVGLVLGVAQGVAYAILMGIGNPNGLVSLAGAASRQGLIGVGWCIVALGVSPYLEKLFDLITPIRLAELANPNRPLLKRLAEEAPGTFQHTLFVTTLAEAGARALKCNVELIRAGTLYHDIGKLHDPQYFIENQFNCTNKHTELDDPWLSAHLIRKHVTEGIVMARKAGLPSAVRAFIPEHQGTMVIAYFYHQACQKAQSAVPSFAIADQDFRYDGPVPQSRETGIVMLADSCEAALRSMKQVDCENALRTVQQIFKARWKEDQLKDSGLTRDDLDILAQTFVQVWQQVNHERIPYPSPIALTQRQLHSPRKGL